MNVAAKIAGNQTARLVSGTQALIDGMLDQAHIDRALGRRTAGFISGYRGSPFGNVDLELWQREADLAEAGILFQPGLNEDIAATACWGTQQVPLMAKPAVDGVFAFWYGKGPGVDRSMDALKHANLAGTSPLGGVVALAGDDHGSKSSSTAHQSEQVFMAAGMPVFNPSTVAEYRALLPTAIALSRFAGVWVGFICVTEVVEASASVDSLGAIPQWVLPEIDTPAGGFHISQRFAPLHVEETLHRYRLPAARRFVLANALDRTTHDAPTRSLGLIAPGKAYLDVQEALRLLHIDAAAARDLGLRIYKPTMTWPLEPDAATRFCTGHAEVLVIEEKRAFVEPQVARLLLRVDNDQRPQLSGKTRPDGTTLLPEHGELNPAMVAIAIGERLLAVGAGGDALRTRLSAITADANRVRETGAIERAPMFCSGCPHNRSTRLPEGSEALGGIGCHGMAMWIPELRTSPSTHMGGEGGTWLGIAPYVEDGHIFQNMGDGTYAHSGVLAIRAAIAAKANITYKVLCNAAVAMTGGQPVEGTPDATAIARQMHACGAARVVVVSEDVTRIGPLPPDIAVRPRDELMAVQRELRDIAGVTVLIYDQGCAAERRRLRKKGQYPDLPIRMFINTDVCEGCGDCNRKSSCVSVLPIDTELGVKRAIDQDSCNKDYTCVEGFCPSFVTVTGGRPRGALGDDGDAAALEARLVTPPRAAVSGDSYNIVIAGIGGTGVVTLGGILSRAAELEGLRAISFDVTGVSQKNGAVFSHVRLLPSGAGDGVRPRVPRGQLDLLVGCDIVASTAREVIDLLAPERTRAVVNTDFVPTGAFQRNPQADRGIGGFQAVLAKALGQDGADYHDIGDGLGAALGGGPLVNIFMLGAACQRGLLPLAVATLESVLGKGRGGARNLRAFRMGRLSVHDRAGLESLFGIAPPVVPLEDRPLEAIIARCQVLLRDYQNTAYADRYARRIAQIARLDPQQRFTRSVAINLFRLMRYKDEYEVARLHAGADFRRRLDAAFVGPVKLSFNLAPPGLPLPRNSDNEIRKIRLGGWMMTVFHILRHFKFLRGTVFDPFGWHRDRRLERRLLVDYEARIGHIAERLAEVNYDVAVRIAELPDGIRGYGHVKEHNARAAEALYAELAGQLTQVRQPVAA